MQTLKWRGARVVEEARLESVYTPKGYQGFESLSLRKPVAIRQALFVFQLCPIHPGEIIKEEVEYRNIKQPKLAEQMGISYKMLNDILNCRRPLTARKQCCLKLLWAEVQKCLCEYRLIIIYRQQSKTNPLLKGLKT